MTTAQDLINSMIEQLGEDYESPKQILDALEDGECLAKMGIDDQGLVEEAHGIAEQMLAKLKIKVETEHCWKKFGCSEKAIEYAKTAEENGWGVARFYLLDDEGVWWEIEKEELEEI